MPRQAGSTGPSGYRQKRDQARETVAAHACADLEGGHCSCCPTKADGCGHAHNYFCSGVDDRSEWLAREQDGLTVRERVETMA